MTTLDACGISCPEPLIMLKNALKSEKELLLLVDSKMAFENCEGYAKKQGFAVVTERNDEVYKLRIKAINA